MVTQAYLQINKEDLKKKATQIIPFTVAGVPCGFVRDIIKEVGENQFFCDIFVYPEKREFVISEIAKEKKMLKK